MLSNLAPCHLYRVVDVHEYLEDSVEVGGDNRRDSGTAAVWPADAAMLALERHHAAAAGTSRLLRKPTTCVAGDQRPSPWRWLKNAPLDLL